MGPLTSRRALFLRHTANVIVGKSGAPGTLGKVIRSYRRSRLATRKGRTTGSGITVGIHVDDKFVAEDPSPRQGAALSPRRIRRSAAPEVSCSWVLIEGSQGGNLVASGFHKGASDDPSSRLAPGAVRRADTARPAPRWRPRSVRSGR